MPNAVVIGASSGIGREIARQLAQGNFRIGVVARNETALSTLAAEIGAEACVVRVMDIAAPEAAAGVRALLEYLQPVQIVYLVAGTGYLNPDLDPLLEQRTIAVNCAGFAAVAAATVSFFRSQGSGHLVALTSVAAVRPSAAAPAYGASKVFGSAYLAALRYGVQSQRLPIRVTEVRPGFVDTAMMKASRPFWVIPATTAARLIIRAANRQSEVVYIPRRWWVVAQLLRLMPSALYRRLVG